MKTVALSIFILGISAPLMLSAQGCTPTNNYFESLGGRSSNQNVRRGDGDKTLVMDDGFEKITVQFGSIPDSTADFTIVNHDARPGDSEVAVTYYYYAGNATETMELFDYGKMAHVCFTDGRITITWSGVNFRGSANGNITYRTACEMTGPM